MDEKNLLFSCEANAVRLERTIVRLWILLVLMLIMLVGTNTAWIYYENQFMDSETTMIEAEQDADSGGSNYLVNGDYGTSESQNNEN